MRSYYVTTLHDLMQLQNMIWYDSSSTWQGQGCPQYLALIVISDITDSSCIYSTMCWIPASVGAEIWIYHMRVRGDILIGQWQAAILTNLRDSFTNCLFNKFQIAFDEKQQMLFYVELQHETSTCKSNTRNSYMFFEKLFYSFSSIY